jgi:(p)ppGpp synthase/HD superfamily hydrolase
MNLSQRYREALVYAFDLHCAQVRKGSGVPYMSHLLGVSSLALEFGANEDEAIAALLHDALEDRGDVVTVRVLESYFGKNVAEIVAGCSDSIGNPKPPWQARKRRYLAHLQDASPSIQLVSACDKLYNLRTIVADFRLVGDEIWSRFTGGRDGVLWYYRSLTTAFTIANPVVGELSRHYTELEQLVETTSPSPQVF